MSAYKRGRLAALSTFQGRDSRTGCRLNTSRRTLSKAHIKHRNAKGPFTRQVAYVAMLFPHRDVILRTKNTLWIGKLALSSCLLDRPSTAEHGFQQKHRSRNRIFKKILIKRRILILEKVLGMLGMYIFMP